MFQYRYNPSFVPLMKEQIWEIGEDMSVYSRLSEYEHEQIKEYLPAKPKKSLELGCGLGRGSIHLNHYYKDPKILYILADRHGITPNSGAFNPDKDEFYNDLYLTQKFCKLNGIEKLEVFDTELDDWNSLQDVDFITSRCSFGMHVSIERYIERIYKAASDKCTLIFGTRHHSYGKDSFKNLFEEVIYLPQEDHPDFPRQNWLILRNKI